MSKLPKQLSTVIELKKSLSKLKNINRSVDELMSLNAPYGEKSDKYEQLSKYIIKANSIQSKSIFYNDPELHFMFAKYYLDARDYSEAEFYIDECIKILPDYYPAKIMKSKIAKFHT